MYKLVAIDLDGTLLDPYGQISQEDKKIIQEALQKKVEIVLATGRSIVSTMNFSKEIGAEHYFISGNGAVIYDLQNEEILYNHYLPKEKVMEIVEFCETNSMYYTVFTESTIITKSLNYNTLFYYYENRNKEEKKKTQINIVEDIPTYIKNTENLNFLKVTICDENNSIFARILEKVKKIKGIDVLEVSHMSRKKIKIGTEILEIQYYYTEITQENTNKWGAIQFLANKLNIKTEEIMTIGDNSNDTEMIKNAGLGIAMENAAPEIKKIADDITTSNEQNGVGQAIKRNVTEILQIN